MLIKKRCKDYSTISSYNTYNIISNYNTILYKSHELN